jgi:predicted RecB family nuclease
MIGVGYFDINNKWIFKEFHMDKLNNQEELITMNHFKDYINEKFEERKILSTNKIRFFHWSAAETSFLESFNNKNNYILGSFLSQIDFADLYKLFITEPICISGCTTFKLKDISKALYNLGLIKSTWKNIDVTNGLTAMLDGCLYYKSIENNTKDEKMNQMFQNIIMYNEVDCKVMGEIVDWMRTYL